MAYEHWVWGGVGAYVPLPSPPCRAVRKTLGCWSLLSPHSLGGQKHLCCPLWLLWEHGDPGLLTPAQGLLWSVFHSSNAT